MRIRNLIIVIFLIFFSADGYAQWDTQVSQYWRTKTFFNPSFAGETSELQATVLHRQQWVGIPDAPKTFVVVADMPIKFMDRVHGVGAIMFTESIGLFSNKLIGGQYVYKKKWKKNTLNLGLQAGFYNVGFDATKIHIPEGDNFEQADDAKPTGDQQSSSLDANLGVSWVSPNYYAGFSVSHITQPSFDLGENHTSFIGRVYYLTAGYNIQFRNTLYELQPSILVKSDAIVTQYDVTARLVYNKMFNGGLTWRKDDGLVFLLGVKIKGFDVGYAYDLSTSAIAKASSGTHEFFIGYTMPITLTKSNNYSHKSVRIL